MASKQEKRRMLIIIIMVCISTHSTTQHKKESRQRVAATKKNWTRMSEAVSTLCLCDQFKRIVCVCTCVYESGTRGPSPHNHDRVHLIDFPQIYLYLNRTVPQRIFFLSIFPGYCFLLYTFPRNKWNYYFSLTAFFHLYSIPTLFLSIIAHRKNHEKLNEIEVDWILPFLRGWRIFWHFSPL